MIYNGMHNGIVSDGKGNEIYKDEKGSGFVYGHRLTLPEIAGRLKRDKITASDLIPSLRRINTIRMINGKSVDSFYYVRLWAYWDTEGKCYIVYRRRRDGRVESNHLFDFNDLIVNVW